MLPVIVLADVSGSMVERGKLAQQDEAIGEMIDAFRLDAATRGAVHLAIIAFGGEIAELVVPLQTVESVAWRADHAAAGGRTPWGAAFALAQDVVRDLPSTTYQPTVVMTSDGVPTDAWEPVLHSFLESKRGGQSHRLAVAIGEDADCAKLAQFTGDPAHVLAAADGSADIVEYFRRITLSVTQALMRGTYESGLRPLSDDF